jgi:hydroxysqualene dehydroxylase
VAKSRVAVVGAGLAGLAAAIELKKRGQEVELFERSRLLGGKATSFEVDGIEVDNGQHVFLACCDHFIEFVEELGSPPGGSPLYLQPRFEAMLLSRSHDPIHLRAIDRGPLRRAPFHLSLALARSRQLGLMGRMQVALALLSLRHSPLPGETFASWLRRYGQGDRARNGFWDPFLVPALNAPMDQVAAAEAAFVIRTAFLEDAGAGRFGYSRVPLGRIAKMVVPRLDRVRLRTPVIGLQFGDEEDGGSWIGLELTGGRVERFDAVVLAVPPARLKAILGGSVGGPKKLGVFGLDQFQDAPIVDIHLWYDVAPGSLLGKGLGFAALMDSPVQWIFEKPAPPGETYLCCSMSAAGRYVGVASRELVELGHRELAAVLPPLREAKLLRGAATRDRDATFVPAVGLVRPGARTTRARVAIAGAWTDTGWPATMESAVRSGQRAVEVLHDTIVA